MTIDRWKPGNPSFSQKYFSGCKVETAISAKQLWIKSLCLGDRVDREEKGAREILLQRSKWGLPLSTGQIFQFITQC